MLTFEVDLGFRVVEDEPRRERRTPNCYQCGRFCRILSESYEFDGQGTNLYITFDCKHCGVFKESMW